MIAADIKRGLKRMLEADIKRDIVRALIREGCYARRLEDKYAVGTLDMIIVTPMHMIYAEAKRQGSFAALMASVPQQDQIKRFNAVKNPHARALVVGYRDAQLGFGLPGERWDKHYTCPWPTPTLAIHFDAAVLAIFGDAYDTAG